tara:strand:+ start:2356 stop:2547 length:192 start_codon:yes stop_codon:yes gene_type:complete
MGVGISHINGALRVYKDTVQAIHSAPKWVVAFGAIAFFTIAGEEFQPAGLSVDHPHAMALGIG